MATYTELASINDDAAWPAFTDKVMVAVLVKAAAILDSVTPTATELDWSKNAIANPRSVTNDFSFYIVAKNNGVSVAVILAASDSSVQNNINDAVDAYNGV